MVKEELGFEPSDSGDHNFLLVEKKNCTTLHVREALAKTFAIAPLHVGYSGLKDKRAITQQWFSIKSEELCQDKPDFFVVGNHTSEKWARVIQIKRHSRKLKIGTHKANHFSLRLRFPTQAGLNEDSTQWQVNIEKALDDIEQYGVPNYFGNQRFGFHGSNLERALEMLESGQRFSREKSGIYLSAARSYLFNVRLAERVASDTWRSYLTGDRLMLSGSKSFFTIDARDQRARIDVSNRLCSRDISIAGSLGASEADRPLDAEADEFSQRIQAGLRSIRFSDELRPLAAYPSQLSRSWSHHAGMPELLLGFTLGAGSYATALVKELGNAVQTDNPAKR